MHAFFYNFRPGMLWNMKKRMCCKAAVGVGSQNWPYYMCISGCSSASELTSNIATDVVEQVFETLRGIARARAHMKQFKTLYSPGGNTHQVRISKLTEQPLFIFVETYECKNVQNKTLYIRHDSFPPSFVSAVTTVTNHFISSSKSLIWIVNWLSSNHWSLL